MNVLSDKRASARARVNMPGRIVVASLDVARDCLIRDLSAHGANLEVCDWAEVPIEFYLLFQSLANPAGRWAMLSVSGLSMRPSTSPCVILWPTTRTSTPA